MYNVRGAKKEVLRTGLTLLHVSAAIRWSLQVCEARCYSPFSAFQTPQRQDKTTL